MDLPTENVQSYPRPPIVEPVTQRIRVTLGGVVIVDSLRALRVLETHHPPTYYIPQEDTDCGLEPLSGRTWCEWKGAARYYNVRAGSRVARRAAWSYDKPSTPFKEIRDHLAFYAALMDNCDVGGVAVLPQEGNFYGGWLTPNLTGIAKGARGTEHW